MRRTRRRDTSPERKLRSALHVLRLRYRLHRRIQGLRTRPDVTFVTAKVAVYINGCFWHGCAAHGTWPKRNCEFWRSKIERNVERDRAIDAILAQRGWRVVRVWEHDDLNRAAHDIKTIVTDRVSSLAQ